MDHPKTHHFIALNDITHKLIREQYDCILNKEEINDQIPKVYQELNDYISKLPKDSVIPITIATDKTVSIATINALNEKYMIQEDDNKFSSDLKIIYFTDKPSLIIDNESSLDNFILSSLFNLVDDPIIKMNLTLDPKQLFLVGLNENNYTEEEKQLLESNDDIQYLTNERINKIGIDKVIYSLNNFASSHPLHIIFDLTVFTHKMFPSVERKSVDHLISVDDINKLIQMLKHKNIVGLDIVGFDSSYDDDKKRASHITAEYVRQLFRDLLQIKEKKINIFTEDSRFLIYRSIEQIDYEDDIGWRILRDVPNEIKEQLLEFVGDEIKTITLPNENDEDEDILVATTNMAEQNEKSYYIAESMFDLCLMPDEKTAMMFELIKN